jgi:hypothetical protein
MGYGTDFKADIFLSRQSYSRKHEVEIRIEELNELIIGCEANLKMYASATPKDIIPPNDSEDPIYWLGARIDEELSMYRDYVIDRYNLDLYLYYLGDKDEIENEQTDI